MDFNPLFCTFRIFGAFYQLRLVLRPGKTDHLPQSRTSNVKEPDGK